MGFRCASIHFVLIHASNQRKKMSMNNVKMNKTKILLQQENQSKRYMIIKKRRSQWHIIGEQLQHHHAHTRRTGDSVNDLLLFSLSFIACKCTVKWESTNANAQLHICVEKKYFSCENECELKNLCRSEIISYYY